MTGGAGTRCGAALGGYSSLQNPTDGSGGPCQGPTCGTATQLTKSLGLHPLLPSTPEPKQPLISHSE